MARLRLNKKDFEILFKENYEGLYYHAFSFTNDEDISRDIIADVFEQLWKERETFDISYSIKPFLYQIVKNKCINYLRHQKVKQKYIDFSIKNQLEVEESHTEYERLIQNIIKKIEELPPKTRIVFEKCFLENKKYRETGDELNISINTVKTHIKKALKILREKVDPEAFLLFLISRRII